MKTEERRLEHFDERIVDLKVIDEVDAAVRHVGENAFLFQCEQRSAVPVRAGEHFARFRQQHLSGIHRDCWHRSLNEECYVVSAQSKVVVFFEVLLSLVAVRGTGHDVPGNPTTCLPPALFDLRSEDLEERRLADLAERKHSFGASKPSLVP